MEDNLQSYELIIRNRLHPLLQLLQFFGIVPHWLESTCLQPISILCVFPPRGLGLPAQTLFPFADANSATQTGEPERFHGNVVLFTPLVGTEMHLWALA